MLSVSICFRTAVHGYKCNATACVGGPYLEVNLDDILKTFSYRGLLVSGRKPAKGHWREDRAFLGVHLARRELGQAVRLTREGAYKLGIEAADRVIVFTEP